MSNDTPWDFNYTAYNEDIIIVGKKSSGKTYLANHILRAFTNVSIIVYDFQWSFHDSRAVVVHNITEVFKVFDAGQKHVIFQPYDKSETAFVQYCEGIFERFNCVALIDEAHVHVSKMKTLKAYNNLILTVRTRGISVISISSRPANLPNNALTNSRHIFAFKLNLESDIKFLQSWLGDQAWELLPKEQRKKNIEMDELPEHSFYYRDTEKGAGMVGKI